MVVMHQLSFKDIAIANRNQAWRSNPQIPGVVDIETVDLDQVFTVPETAQYCHKSMINCMIADGVHICDYNFVEPSAGDGAFYDLLPEGHRIGIDILPQRSCFIEHDFLTWNIKPNGHRYAVIGNPPFGYRAWLALAFMNHAAKFADYVGMILPMAFQSDGKGSPKHRVQGLKLVHSEVLPSDSFVDTFGKPVRVNVLWQVWKRGENIKEEAKTCSKWMELFTVDQRKERLCGQIRMHEADFFLQRTFYDDPPQLVKCFSQVKYVCGYGIILKKEKRKITKILRNTNWISYSNLATHNCRHISMYHIQKSVVDAGFVDD